MEPIGDVELFVRVARTLSFSRTAREMGTTRSHVSKRIARLEGRLGVVLLQRTTRSMQLTPPGEALLHRAGPLVAGLRNAEELVSAMGGSASGTVRLAAPLAFGLRRVVPVVHRFCEQHPDIRVDVSYSDARVDLIAEGMDLAVRGGVLSDSTLVATRIRPITLCWVAASHYLEAHGTPAEPSDLDKHSTILPHPAPVTFSSSQRKVSVKLKPRMVCNNADARLQAAADGLGIAMVPDFVLEADALTRVLRHWNVGSRAFWLVRPPGPQTQSARLLATALVSGLRH